MFYLKGKEQYSYMSNKHLFAVILHNKSVPRFPNVDFFLLHFVEFCTFLKGTVSRDRGQDEPMEQLFRPK
jgi:hypothetical protein